MYSRVTLVSFVLLILSSGLVAQSTGTTQTSVTETSTSSATSSATSAPMTTSSFSVSGSILPISPPSTDPTSVPPNLSSSRGDHPTGVTNDTTTSSAASATAQNGALSTTMGALGSWVLVVGSIVFVREHIL